MQQKVDLIVTEIFDSGLLGEGVLPSLRHAMSSLAKVRVLLCHIFAIFLGELLSIRKCDLRNRLERIRN